MFLTDIQLSNRRRKKVYRLQRITIQVYLVNKNKKKIKQTSMPQKSKKDI